MIGSSFAHYRITGKLGEGGMGEVYRATDDRLNRDVAIKLLPPAVESDATRLARFRREAQLLAALSHQNIAAVYGLEEQEGKSAIVLELVEGETLAERIARGAIPVEEAREIALQIAEALEAAHEKGIVHRDLKPANVKITPEGTVKVLDFGLAKALEEDPSESDISASPTLTAAATQAGVILGTAAYMSPEQAKGKPVDRRADIWAFGCVLYEMLTGRAPFTGDGVSELLAHVITQEPDLDRLPGGLPDSLNDTIRRCMRKDPRMRLPDIAAARIALTEVDGPAPKAEPRVVNAPWSGWGSRAALIFFGLVVGLVAGWVLLGGRGGSPSNASHFDLLLNPPPTWNGTFALSADGETLAYPSDDGLYVRRLDGYESVKIPGTEGAQSVFFSHDGEHLGFLAAGRLKRVNLAGGLPEPICGAAGTLLGVDWATDDTIYYSTNATVVPHRVDANGGEPTPLTIQDLEAGGEIIAGPLLPDESGLIVSKLGGTLAEPRIGVLDLADGSFTELTRGADPKLLTNGRLLYTQQGRAMLVRLAPGGRSLDGPATQAPLDKVAVDASELMERSYAAQSATGMLVYTHGEIHDRTELVRITPEGVAEPTGFSGSLPQADREGNRVLAYEEGQINVTDLRDGTTTRLTFGAPSGYPHWSPDEEEAWFSSSRSGRWHAYSVPIDGQGDVERLDGNTNQNISTSAGRSGVRMAYEVNAETNRDVFMVGPDGSVEMLLQTEANERSPMISPDGTLFAYVSDEEGSDHVYVRTLPLTDRRWRVSVDGGISPVWRRDGNAVYFFVDDTIHVAEVRSGGAIRIGTAQPVYTNPLLSVDPWGNRSFDALPDGGLIVSVREEIDVTVRAILNWDPD